MGPVLGAGPLGEPVHRLAQRGCFQRPGQVGDLSGQVTAPATGGGYVINLTDRTASAKPLGYNKGLADRNKMDTDETDWPGGELDKLYRDAVEDLIVYEGWRYRRPSGDGFAKLLPASPARGAIRVPAAGQGGGRLAANWVSAIRRAGGHVTT
jgi:hypothetical protein